MPSITAADARLRHAGIPVAPISVAYSLQSSDLAKIKYITELLNPGLVYVADTGPFAKALAR